MSIPNFIKSLPSILELNHIDGHTDRYDQMNCEGS
jgi:hypothetical protein